MAAFIEIHCKSVRFPSPPIPPLAFADKRVVGQLEHDLTGRYPGTNGPGAETAFIDKWHHGAIVYKTGQLKCYIDQYRVLVVPDFGAAPTAIGFGGPSSADNPLGFNNVRIATGGGMNLIDKLTKDGRIVTHGILHRIREAQRGGAGRDEHYGGDRARINSVADPSAPPLPVQTVVIRIECNAALRNLILNHIGFAALRSSLSPG